MAWVFMANAWKDPLANTMLGVSGVVLSIYLISRFTGALSFLELTRPFWTVSALVSIVIWNLVFAMLPVSSSSSTGATQAISRNMLEYFVSPDVATNFLQSWLFPVTESLLVAVVVAFFVGVAYKRGLGNPKRAGLGIVGAVLIGSVFGAILHISIAVTLAESGTVSPMVLFAHQLLSFFIFIAMGVFTPFGAVAIISSHIIKNALVFATPAIWIAIFSIFILLDVLSYIFAHKKEKSGYIQSINAFVK